MTQTRAFVPGPNPIAVVFDVEPGWHIYGKDPGDTGMATTVALESGGPLRWPPPTTFVDDVTGFRTFGYTDEVALVSSVVVVAPRPRSVEVSGKVTWLACRERCVYGEADLSQTVRVRKRPGPLDPAFGRYLEALTLNQETP